MEILPEETSAIRKPMITGKIESPLQQRGSTKAQVSNNRNASEKSLELLQASTNSLRDLIITEKRALLESTL